MLPRRLSSLVRRLIAAHKNRLPRPTAEEAGRIEELRASIQALPAIDLHGGTPAANEWAANRAALRSLILQSDPRKFLTWGVIRETMQIDGAFFAQVELEEMSKLRDARWDAALKENRFGLSPASRWLATSSDNLIHHVYAISRLERTSNVKIDSLSTVVEFGGGYGSVCRVMFSLGFRGRYIIFDLPEFSALQRYFLRTLGLPVRPRNAEGSSSAPSITCISELEAIQTALASDTGPELMIGMWSLSETPLSLREQFLRAAGPARHYFFAYQDRFGEANNNDYFDGLARAIPAARWNHVALVHMPGHHHLFGNPG